MIRGHAVLARATAARGRPCLPQQGDNDFTNRNTTLMTWNLLHLARTLKDVGGFPVYGNQRSQWDAGCRFDFENPEHR